MNRLVLIGNGFDLAHGLKTSYKDFLDDFWATMAKELIPSTSSGLRENKYVKIFNAPAHGNHDLPQNYFELSELLHRTVSELTIQNAILRIITEKTGLENWVDIESEYYKILVEYSEPKYQGSVSGLNEQFNDVKNLLIEYLHKTDTSFKYNDNIFNHLKSGINLRDCREENIDRKIEYWHSYFHDFQKSVDEKTFDPKSVDQDTFGAMKTLGFDFSKENIKQFLMSTEACYYNKFDLMPQNTLFLSFNYTNTVRQYFNQINLNNKELIYIHGELTDIENNPIIFGFGDELDEKYKQMEGTGNKDFLDNVKSVNYLKTANYKKLLEFINSDDYQVYVMGHSCGLSDRTLLNTIFEHDKCVSIKPYYYINEEGKDNYTSIVQSISRNFVNKARMRDVVVNKTFCETLI